MTTEAPPEAATKGLSQPHLLMDSPQFRTPETIELLAELRALRAELAEKQAQQGNVAAIPEFVRIPAPNQRCPYTGLSRATVCRLIKSGRVRSKSVKTNPDHRRGSRLIVGSSLLAYISRSE